MSPFSITRTTTEGFESTCVHTGLIELTLISELGGKISSLRDTRTNREWLWRNPRYPYKRVPHGSSYIAEADTGGWDECFPSVSACSYPAEPWQGVAIQDHGELWSQVSELEIDEHEHDETITLLAGWHGVALPYTFTRTIRLFANSAVIRVNYEVVNNADQSMNYVWSIHPLLAIEPGMELHLPHSARFHVAGSIPQDLVSPEQNIQYPFAAPGLNFPAMPETSAGCAIKIWSDPLPAGEGWAAIRANDGELKMRWDVALLPQVAAWMNFGAWAADGGTPYYNLGLEPCIGAQDSLADAVTQYQLFATLPPDDPKTWWLEIELIA
jgi:galactose mutarotase-like enzyme